MTDESSQVYVPMVQGMHMGVSFFSETAPEPVIVVSLSGVDAEGTGFTFYGAFTPTNLQHLIPEIVEAVIRAQTITEMITTWPEQREEILKNLAFRWTGHMDPGDDGLNGAQIEGA